MLWQPWALHRSAVCQLRMITSHLQANPNQMAVGADDQYVRLWDRRMLSAGGHLPPRSPVYCADEGVRGHLLQAIHWHVT